MSSVQKTLSSIDSFLKLVKSGEANTEAGSIGGETSHPVKDVEDGTEPAKEGERSAENERDVKEDQGPAGVDSTPEATPKVASFERLLANFAKRAEGQANPGGTAADDHQSVTTTVSSTGKDPANETSKAKGGKDDPGSTHPARTDNDALEGGKYAFDHASPLEKLAEDLGSLGNTLVAAIAAISDGAPVKAASDARARQAAPTLDPRTAYQAGWEVMGLLDGSFDKTAADRMVVGELMFLIKEAEDIGDKVADFYDSFFAKRAEGDDGGGDPPPDPGAGGNPGGGPGGPGGPGGGPDMLGALGGAGGGDPGPGGDGHGGDEDEAAMLGRILESLGVTPEELEQAMAAEAAGGAPPGGAPPGGAPPGGAPGMPGPGGPGGGPGAGGMETQAGDRYRDEKIAASRAVIREIVSRSRQQPRR